MILNALSPSPYKQPLILNVKLLFNICPYVLNLLYILYIFGQHSCAAQKYIQCTYALKCRNTEMSTIEIRM